MLLPAASPLEGPNKAPRAHTRQPPSLEGQDCPSHLTYHTLTGTRTKPQPKGGILFGVLFETRSLYPRSTHGELWLQMCAPTPGFFSASIVTVSRGFETGSHLGWPRMQLSSCLSFPNKDYKYVCTPDLFRVFVLLLIFETDSSNSW